MAWGIQEAPFQEKSSSEELTLSLSIVTSLLKDTIKQGHH